MARTKSKNYLPYLDAATYMQSRYPHIKTRAQYIRWHKDNKPGFLPAYPYRVYDNFSWRQFLDTTNSFEKTMEYGKTQKRVYRPYWEAVRYAQQAAKQYNINSKTQWDEWYDSGMAPSDIPKRPQDEYDEWKGRGWGVWLGKDVHAKAEVAGTNVAVLLLCRTPGCPDNIITFHIDKLGVSHLRENWNTDKFGKAVRLYEWDNRWHKQVEQVLNQNGFKKEGDTWLVPNLHALLFEMDSILVKAKTT